MRLGLGLIPLLLAVASCAALSPAFAPSELHLAGVAKPVREGDVLETATGSVLTFEQMLARLRGVPIVYVGETHDRAEDHHLQLRVIRGLHENDAVVQIGMEMFPRSGQDALDRYIKGELADSALRESVNWAETWGYDFELYAPILQYARGHQIPILALNAPAAVVRKVAREGLSGLSQEEKRGLPGLWPTLLDDYRDFLETQYESHRHGDGFSFDHFVEAQLLWDGTMAETLTTGILARRRPAPLQSVVLAGKGHLLKGMGIPRTVHRRIPLPYRVVIPLRLAGEAEIDLRLGDYLVFVQKERGEG